MKMAELSRQTGLSRHTLYDLYHERSTRLDYDTLEKLCQALDCSVGDLLEFVPDEK